MAEESTSTKISIPTMPSTTASDSDSPKSSEVEFPDLNPKDSEPAKKSFKFPFSIFSSKTPRSSLSSRTTSTPTIPGPFKPSSISSPGSPKPTTAVKHPILNRIFGAIKNFGISTGRWVKRIVIGLMRKLIQAAIFIGKIIWGIIKAIGRLILVSLRFLLNLVSGIFKLLGGIFKLIFNIFAFLTKIIFISIVGIFKFVSSSVKFLIRQIWSASKWTFSNLKYLILTKPGAKAVGFIAGVIYESILKPIGDSALYVYENWDEIKEKISLKNLKKITVNFAKDVIDHISNIIPSLEDIIQKSKLGDDVWFELNEYAKGFTDEGLYGITSMFESIIGAIDDIFGGLGQATGGFIGGIAGGIAGQLIGLHFGGPLGQILGAVIGGAIVGSIGSLIGGIFDEERKKLNSPYLLSRYEKGKTPSGVGIRSRNYLMGVTDKPVMGTLSPGIINHVFNAENSSKPYITDDGKGTYDKISNALASLTSESPEYGINFATALIDDSTEIQSKITKFKFKNIWNETNRKKVIESISKHFNIQGLNVKNLNEVFNGDFKSDYEKNDGIVAKILKSAITEISESNKYFKDHGDEIFKTLKSNEFLKEYYYGIDKTTNLKTGAGYKVYDQYDIYLKNILKMVDNFNSFLTLFDYLTHVTIGQNINDLYGNRLSTILAYAITQNWYNSIIDGNNDMSVLDLFKSIQFNLSIPKNELDTILFNYKLSHFYTGQLKNSDTLDKNIDNLDGLNTANLFNAFTQSEIFGQNTKYFNPIYDDYNRKLLLDTVLSALKYLRAKNILTTSNQNRKDLDDLYLDKNKNDEIMAVGRMFMDAYTYTFLDKLTNSNITLTEIGEKTLEFINQYKNQNTYLDIFQQDVLESIQTDEGHKQIISAIEYLTFNRNLKGIINSDINVQNNEFNDTEAIELINKIIDDNKFNDNELQQIEFLRKRLDGDTVDKIIELIRRKINPQENKQSSKPSTLMINAFTPFSPENATQSLTGSENASKSTDAAASFLVNNV